MESKAHIPLVSCALVCLLSLLVLALDANHWKSLADQEMRWFQGLTGGLGMGAVAVPAWNMIDYDPRLQPVDESKLWPLPGSYPYSPAGTSSVTRFPEILENDKHTPEKD